MFVMSTAITILITLVRHGQTDYNLKHFTQGQSNIPLNDEGRNQAVLAGKSLKNQNFDVIYSSDLLRAFETTEKIIEQSDVLESSYQIRSEILLRETSHGVFENRPSEDLKNAAKAAGFVEPELKKFRPQNGENEDDVSIRAQTFLTKILKEDCEKQKANSDILVVSHGRDFTVHIHHSYNGMRVNDNLSADFAVISSPIFYFGLFWLLRPNKVNIIYLGYQNCKRAANQAC